MNIGIFSSPVSSTILLVMNYEEFTRETVTRGYGTAPILSRRATTPEIVAYEERNRAFPAWQYNNHDELMEDEEQSGASREYLIALMNILRRISEQIPIPGPAGSLILSLLEGYE